jgi:hypothetical protein
MRIQPIQLPAHFVASFARCILGHQGMNGAVHGSLGLVPNAPPVMTENATHHLKEHFGDKKVTYLILLRPEETCAPGLIFDR